MLVGTSLFAMLASSEGMRCTIVITLYLELTQIKTFPEPRRAALCCGAEFLNDVPHFEHPMTSTQKTPSGVWIGDRFLPATDLRERAGRVAAGLQSLGVGPGDVIAVLARNSPAVLEIALGSARVGATIAPVNTAWRTEEVRYVLEDSKAKVLFGQVDLARPLLDGVPPQMRVVGIQPASEVITAYGIDAAALSPLPGRDDYDAWIATHAPLEGTSTSTPVPGLFYTSGTTGKPKGVIRAVATPGQAAHRATVLQTCYGIGKGARSLITTPLYHVFASAHAQTTLAQDGVVVLLPHFDAETFLALVERHAITNIQMVPTMFVRLLRLPEAVRRKYDLRSIRHVLHTGAPCPVHVKRAMIDWWGPVLWEQYGSTESGVCVLCNTEEWLAHPGTVGKPFLGSRAAVYGPDGKTVAPRIVGDVYMRMPGSPDFNYLGNEEARRAIERDGLITSGDVGYLDEDGYLYLSDRRADVVISGGTNIYPAEIESVLSGMPGVRDCAVIGVPHEEFGEQLSAYVVADPAASLTAEAVQAFVRERLAGYKVPRLVTFVESVPRDDGGKILRRKVREQYAATARAWNA